MAPTKKVKTYNRSSSNINSSVDAVNLLFAKNITQRIISKKKIGKKKVILKELPKRTQKYILSDDSLQVSTEDTFDKLRKGSSYNKLKEESVDVKALESTVPIVQNNVTKKYGSFNVTDFSPIATRNRRKFSKSLRNKSDSLLQRFKEPTIEILNSIEIETCRKKNDSSSYIKLPNNQICSNISCNNVTHTTSDCSKMEESFTKIFSKTFFQNQPNHCSTPVPSVKQKQLSTTKLIVPLLQESLGEIRSWEYEFPIAKETESASIKAVEDSQESSIFNNVNYINLRGRRVNRSYDTDDKNASKSEVIYSRTYNLDNFNAFENRVNSIYDSVSKHQNSTNPDDFFSIDMTKTGSLSSNIDESIKSQDVIVRLTNNIQVFEQFYQDHYSEVDQNLTKSSNYNLNCKDLIVNITRQEDRFEKFYCKHYGAIEADIHGRRDSETDIIENIVTELIINVTRHNLDKINVSKTHNVDIATYTTSNQITPVDSSIKINSDNDKPTNFSHNINSICETESGQILRNECFEVDKINVSKIHNVDIATYTTSNQITPVDSSIKIHSDNDKRTNFSNNNNSICETESGQILRNECFEVDSFIIESSFDNSAYRLIRNYQTINKKNTNEFKLKSLKPSSKHKDSKQLKIQNSVIDLTESLDEPTRFSKIPLESSDIIESSIYETNNIVESNFKVPQVLPNKTLPLKPGKLWRRSLLMYKRSNDLKEIREICSAGPSCKCKSCIRRSSIKIIPIEKPVSNVKRRTSILEEYALSTSYVPEQIIEENLEKGIGSISLIEESCHILDVPPPITARDVVLRKCGQIDVIPFQECYPESFLRNCHKIGEGVYGEVFLLKNPNGGTSVIKIIPIEGNLIVNGERQKKFDEIMSEIIIATELSNLRFKKINSTNAFNEVQQVKLVQGSYPPRLLDLWDLFEEVQGSENDCPEIFPSNQLFVILQLANGGKDLESFVFNNAKQAYAMFEQVALALAVAESELGFEHRDLHWGNILLSSVDKKKSVFYKLNGQSFEISTTGVEVAIIDFTLSRIEHDGVVMFNDLALDAELFTGDGDYQFDIYRLMKKKNGNNWQNFEPYSNVLWLHYILGKAISALRYKYTKSNIHKEFTAKMKHLYDEILNYKSVKDFVLSCIVTK